VLSTLLVLGWLWKGRARPPAGDGARRRLRRAVFVLPSNAALWSRLHAERPGQRVAWAEDRSGVAFFRDDATSPDPHGPFFIQGFSQGRIPFLPIHQFLGAVGPLIHPNPERVLCIGIGSGGTPWAAGVSPATREVRAIELVGPVLTALEELGARHPDRPDRRDVPQPALAPRIRRWPPALSKGEELYDVIQADAILPEGSHSGLLYSEEFLQSVRRRLAPGGIYVQWGPTERTVETFASVFPHTLLLMPGSVLIGSNSPIPFDAAELSRRFARPEVAAHLARGNRGFDDYASLFARPPLSWGPGSARAEPSLTDVFPRDEFYLNNAVTGTQALSRPSDLIARAPHR
jgi:hypothetical protein